MTEFQTIGDRLMRILGEEALARYLHMQCSDWSTDYWALNDQVANSGPW